MLGAPASPPWLLVGLFAVKNALDLYVPAQITKEHAVILRPQTNHWRNYSPQLPGVAFACQYVASNGLQDLQCCRLINVAKVGFGQVRPYNGLRHRYLRFAAHLFPIPHCQSEFGKHLLVGNWIVMLAPLVRCGNRLRFRRTQSVSVFVQERLQQMDDGGQTSLVQAVKQLVSMFAHD